MKHLLSFIFTVVLIVPAYSQKSADLTYKLELNKTYRVKTTTIQNRDMTVQGSSMSIGSTNLSVFSLKPLKQLDGEMIAEVRFDTIINSVSMPPMEMNSTNPGDLNSMDAGEIMSCILHRLSNSTFLIKMAHTGQVVEIMNLDPIVSGILQGTDSLQGPMGSVMKPQIDMMVEEDALKSMIEGVTVYLPGKEIKKGKKWEINMDMTAGGMEMSVAGTYKLLDIENTTATISADFIIETAPSSESSMRGLGKSELKVDIATGWIIESTAKQTLTGEISTNMQGTAVTIPMEITSDSESVALP